MKYIKLTLVIIANRNRPTSNRSFAKNSYNKKIGLSWK
ncbi:hypothetical protein LEP1GSC043_2231 [Leptospira weilii str. Ecochallenge]|uniref:Uncharacterized protein n=1 Tax=Leptospira weilii str. Ecochallenge TaxID=1049986 RepID=N1U090_9LEPT|nr:hypothetical protein LEP1GSC043_2231 [Leptospira weilii str. Ecochallenge]